MNYQAQLNYERRKHTETKDKNKVLELQNQKLNAKVLKLERELRELKVGLVTHKGKTEGIEREFFGSFGQ